MTTLEILELVRSYCANEIQATYLKHQIKERGADLDALIQAERIRGFVQPTKPQGAVPTYSNNSTKEYFHMENSEGRRCFDIYIRNERAQGIIHPDRGSPPFAARMQGICTCCGESISIGDMISMRTKFVAEGV